MGITTKIFIVLNLIVAFFTGAAAFVVYGKQLYWVEQTEKAVASGNTMYAKMDGDIKRLEIELAQLKEKSLTEKAQIAVLTSEKEKLLKENALQTQTIEEKSSTINNLNDTIKQNNIASERSAARNKEIQERLDAEILKNNAALKEADYHQAQSIEVAAELRQAENEMMQLSKSNAELVRRVTLVTSQLEKYVERYGADPVAGQQTEVAINGRVMQIEPTLDLVILSVGEKDKVTKGMEFVISRGDSYIAKVRVANVYDNMCSARIISGMTKQGEAIKVSDAASTL